MPSGRPNLRGHICLGKIMGVHGVRGHLKIKAYTDNPGALDRYGPVLLDDGRVLNLAVKSVTPKGAVIVIAREITDRNDAEKMRGLELFIDRDALPPVDGDELYHADLIGLMAEGEDSEKIGKIVGIHDFGAGELVEIKPPSGPTIMLPFAAEFRGEIALDQGLITLRPPAGMLAVVMSKGSDSNKPDPIERDPIERDKNVTE